MKATLVIASFLLSAGAAAQPADYAKQWPVSADSEGAYAVTLDESVYRQIVQNDLSDLAAFNADGEALPFGPMPADYRPPPSVWRQARWFFLPVAVAESTAGDLHLHINRAANGKLTVDATLGAATTSGEQNLLIDVQATHEAIEAIAFDLSNSAADFSTEVNIEASDDLQHWRPIVVAAVLAQLHRGGQTLSRRHIEFSPVQANYLLVHAINSAQKLPVTALKLQLQPASAQRNKPQHNWFTAESVGRDGLAFIYHLPARIAVEQVAIELADNNTIADFDIATRDDPKSYWQTLAQLSAFRLRGARLQLDNEAIDIAPTRQREWRIEPNTELAKAPALKFAYRPETWLLLTHGKAPYVISAGSRRAHRGYFSLEAMVKQIRAKYGVDWQPPLARLAVMQNAGGDDALRNYNPDQKKTWVLWAVLLLGAITVVVMVLRLLKSPDQP